MARWGMVGAALVATLAGLCVAPGPVAAQAPPAPAVTVSPGTGLLDRHDVAVTVTGLAPGQSYVLVDCAADACVDPSSYTDAGWSYAPPAEVYDPLRRTVVGGQDGTATTRVDVRRSITVGSPDTPSSQRTADCSAEACTMALVADPDGATRLAETPLSFAPTGTYAWPAAAMTVSPDGPFVHGDAITLTGSGFVPDAFDFFPIWPIWGGYPVLGHAGFDRCVDDGGDAPPCGVPGTAPNTAMFSSRFPIADDGTVSASVGARRWAPGPGGEHWNRRDCALVECTLVLYQPGRSWVAAPLDLGPVWAPWTSARAMVDDLAGMLGADAMESYARADLARRIADGEVSVLDAVRHLARRDKATPDVTTLYASLLKRRPDLGGLAYWVERLRSGTSPGRVADAFSNTPEARAALQGLSDADAVEWAYQATLGRASDPGGKAYWVGRLGAGLPRYRMLSMFALAPESKARTAGVRELTTLTVGLTAAVPTADAWQAASLNHLYTTVNQLWGVVETAPAFRSPT